MSATSRFFQTPQLKDPFTPEYKESDYAEICLKIAQKCWNHYSSHNIRATKKQPVSLYLGSLGPNCYLRLRLALHEKKALERQIAQAIIKKDAIKKKESHINHLLRDALRAADEIIKHNNNGLDNTCSFLEGSKVSALALKSVILKVGMGKLEESNEVNREVLETVQRETALLLPSECEVLYGRAGALQIILFLRKYLQEPMLGRDLVLSLINNIITQGEILSHSSPTKLPLVWEWYEHVYLGAAHGIVGILFTLLHFVSELQDLGNAMNKDYLSMIRRSVDALQDMLLPSGNLPSTLGDDRDYLVHWCNGSPGHVLLLVKCYEIFQETDYLDKASNIAWNVVFSRGLLRKGVGLCHGISGNAYVFLALHRAERARSSSSVGSNYNNQWLHIAYHFADFAIGKYNELELLPDRPYSLYEGCAGLSMLVLDLMSPNDAKFPCYEY